MNVSIADAVLVLQAQNLTAFGKACNLVAFKIVKQTVDLKANAFHFHLVHIEQDRCPELFTYSNGDIILYARGSEKNGDDNVLFCSKENFEQIKTAVAELNIKYATKNDQLEAEDGTYLVY